MKKLLSFALAMVLMLSLSVTVFAAGGTGSITINGIVDGVDYEIYKLLHLESYDKVSGAYSYTVDPAWTAFFATAEAQTYITVDSDGYITLTEEGRLVAQKVYSRHEILTAFLVSLGVSEDTASEDACSIEHRISDESFEAIRRHVERI